MTFNYDFFVMLGLCIFILLSIMVFTVAFSEPEQNDVYKKSMENEDLVLTFDSSSNSVFLNNSILLSLKSGSANHRFIKYLFEHSEVEIPILKLYSDLRLPEDTYINKLIANTKLPKNVRDCVFVVDKEHIIFSPKI